MKLKKIKLSNFKKFKEHEVEIPDDIFDVSGENAIGKTTLATSVLWVLTDSDFELRKNPVVRHEVNGEPVNDVPVEAELIFTDRTKDISFKKVQNRSIKKDESYADANTYFVNEVERTMRDFNSSIEEVFGCSMKELPMCLNINSFLSQKPDAMRTFLFDHVESKSDLEIAQTEQGFDDLKELLEKYTLEEVSSLYKASKSKIQKTLDDIPVAIAQEQKHIVEMDTAEDELAIRGLEKDIADIKKKMEDVRSMSDDAKKKSDALMRLQFKKSEMERETNQDITEKKSSVQKELDDLKYKEYKESMNIQTLENDLEVTKVNLEAHKKSLQEFREEYIRLKNLEFDESKKVCPVCGQTLPDADIEKLISSFNDDKDKNVASVIKNGNRERESVVFIEEKIAKLEFKIKQSMEQKKLLQSQINDKQKELNEIPDSVDMSTNEAYQNLLKEISDAEKSLSEENTTDDYLDGLKAQKKELEGQLAVHKDRVSRVMKNAEHEEEIDRLEALRNQKEQDKATCQNILDQIEALDKKKNELLVSDINKLFGIVKWKLFSYKKNGTYEKCCIPMVDGYEFGKTTNKAREIFAKVDIAVSIQNMIGVNIPIVLDNAESLDRENREKLKDFGRQMILLRVKGD